MIYEYNLTDHLGNTRITFGDEDADGLADILQENHYYPFGMAMTMASSPSAAPPNDYLYNGKELQDELDLGWYDYGARMYDASIGRWNGVDALAEERNWLSSWQYTQNNPILRIDSDGNLDGEYEVTFDEEGWEVRTKVSSLGDEDGVDFLHFIEGENAGRTKIVNTNNGFANWVSDSDFIRDYTLRDESVNWYTLFSEWKHGNGPENSLIFGKDHPMIQDIRKSNLYASARREYTQNHRIYAYNPQPTRLYMPIDFGLFGLVVSGNNMTMQMIGSFGVSFYELADGKMLVLATDSKTRESFYYHLPVENSERPVLGWPQDESTTRQTYMWIDNGSR